MNSGRILFILAAVAAINGEIELTLGEIGLRSGSILTESAEKTYNQSEVCTRRYSCLSCTTSRVCAPRAKGTFVEILRNVCPETAPYCDYETGTCSAVQSLNCSEAGSMTCIQDGYFPHPETCKKFFYCKDLVSYTFTCSGSKVYDATVKQCSDRYTCRTFDCFNKDGTMVPYPTERSIYAYCNDDYAAVVDRCDGQDEFNEAAQKCLPVCRGQGLMADSQDRSRYYKCTVQSVVGNNITYSMTHHSCPKNELFYPEDFQCQSSLLETRFGCPPCPVVSDEFNLTVSNHCPLC